MWSCGVERCTVSHNVKAYFSNMLLNSMHKHCLILLATVLYGYRMMQILRMTKLQLMFLFCFILLCFDIKMEKIKPDILGL